MKYLAFDAINGVHEDFETIKEAQEYLEEIFLDDDEGFHPDMDSCAIYQLVQIPTHKVIAIKSDFTDEEWEANGYSLCHDEIWEHEFKDL